jgi:hypothetical protein
LSGNAIQDFSSLQQYWTKFICKTEKEKHAKNKYTLKCDDYAIKPRSLMPRARASRPLNS